ncbi:MAG: response regulator [Candidatus Latescibacteria bacterium]|nr:response regulator [Candidatus Latescibacterota bacterium]
MRCLSEKKMKMRRILIVDDLQDVREMLLEILVALGYEAQTANDGTQALAKLESDPFDMVISDVKMPTMDGLSLLKSVKQRSPDFPVLLIAGHQSSVSQYEAVHYRADGFLQKPFHIGQLSEAVERALKGSNGH